MFRWFKGKPKIEPKPCAANAGNGVTVQVAFSNGERSWQEEASMVDLLAELMSERGVEFQKHKGWLELSMGLRVLPQFESLVPLEDGGARTVSTIETSHPTGIPEGVFEYQHGTGNDLRAAFASGFASWLDVDFPVLRDAVLMKPEDCTTLELKFSNQEAKRRVLLGPVTRMARNEVLTKEDEHPPFCTCCLFTNTSTAFDPLLKGTRFHGIRYFAARGDDGTPTADCRVNGLDCVEGQAALLEYVKQWPGQGFESRKQYVILHTR